jgi:hypothetical protein
MKGSSPVYRSSTRIADVMQAVRATPARPGAMGTGRIEPGCDE